MPRHLKNPLNDFTSDEISKRIDEARKKNTIGDLVRWGCQGVEIGPDKLEEFLKLRGVLDFKPVPIRNKKAARKAVSAVRRDLEEGDLKVLMRPVRDTDTETRYALVDEEVDREAATLGYSLRNQVIFSKENLTISFTGQPIKEVVDRYDYYCNVYTDVEVDLMVKNIVTRHGGISLRDHSGMYFIPAAMRHVTDALSDLLNKDINGNYGKAFFRPFGLLDNSETKNSVGSVFKTDIEEELNEAQEVLDKLLQQSEVTEAQANRAMERFRVAKQKAAMYTSLLSIKAEEIVEVIEAGEEVIKDFLVGEPVEA